jgi:hypothetical protein
MRRSRPNRHEPYVGVKENVLVASSVFVRCRRESGERQRARHGSAWCGFRREERGALRPARGGQAGRHGRLGSGALLVSACSKAVRTALSFSMFDAAIPNSILERAREH